MLLAVDIGNSQIVFGIFRDSRLVATWRFSSNSRQTADEYFLLMVSALQRYECRPSDINAAIIASATPLMQPVLESVCHELFGFSPQIVGPGTKTKLRIKFEPPSDLSGDRIANAVAGYYLYGGGPMIVIDFGTATTFDVVSAKGEYLGGALTPGIRLSAEVLAERTSRIPRVDLIEPPSVVGKSTAQALQSGLVYGHVELLDGMVERIKREVGHAKVIATGDYAKLLSRLSRRIERVVPHLTLEGLRMLWEFNSDNRL